LIDAGAVTHIQHIKNLIVLREDDPIIANPQARASRIARTHPRRGLWRGSFIRGGSILSRDRRASAAD